MKAIRMHRTGGPSVLKYEEVAPPEPGRGELLIEVRAASVNPVDAKIRQGKFKLFKARLPADQRFEEETGDIDLVFDLVAGETQDRSWAVLKKRGGAIVSTLTEPSRAQARKQHARGLRMVVEVKRRQLDEIARLVVARRVRVTVSQVFPLRQARQAHVRLETGHGRGKIELKVA